MPPAHPGPTGQAGRRRVQDQRRRLEAVPNHFHLVKAERAEADAEGLHGGLLGGKAGRKPRDGVVGGPGVAALAFREQPVDEVRPTGQHQAEPIAVHGVDAHAHEPPRCHRRGHKPLCRRLGECGHRRGTAVDRHSTVTTLARLRGRSTSWPWRRASEKANSCRGTTSTIGANRYSVSGTHRPASAWRAVSWSPSLATSTTVAPRLLTSATFAIIFS